MTDGIKPAIRPATRPQMFRCPLQAPSYAFDNAVCQCVQLDTHAGVCRTIDGSDLTAEPYSPRQRYRLMGLEPRADLPLEGEPS